MVDLQGMKDTFYAALRDRVAANNAGRTVVVRGVVRPGVVVVENELPGAAVDGIALVECFCLRWTSVKVETGLARLGCEIRYATDGVSGSGGMDRGTCAGGAGCGVAGGGECRAATCGGGGWDGSGGGHGCGNGDGFAGVLERCGFGHGCDAC